MSTLKQAVRMVTIVCDGCARSRKCELMLVKVYLWEFCDFHNDCTLYYIKLLNLRPESMRVTCCVAVGGAAMF
jgi:hypothetical protein